MRYGILFLGSLVMLGGCADLEEFLRPFPERQRLPEKKLDYHPGESAIWCYESLAEPDCFSGPQGGPPNRLIERYEDQTVDLKTDG